MSIIPQRPSVPQESSALLNDLQSEVAVEAAPLLQLIVKYVWLIVLVLVLLIIALAGTAGYQWYARYSAEQAQEALRQVLQGTSGEQRIAALEKFLPGAPESVKTAALLAIADTATRLGRYDVAAAAYGRVNNHDVDGGLGLMSSLNQAQLLMHAGKPAEAIPVLEQVENTVPEAHRMLVNQLLAEAAVLAGRTDLAKKTFEVLAAKSGGAEKLYYEYRLQTLGQAPAAK